MLGTLLQPGNRRRPFVIGAIVLVALILVGLLAIGGISLLRKSAEEVVNPTATVPISTPTRMAAPATATYTHRPTNTPVISPVIPTTPPTAAPTATMLPATIIAVGLNSPTASIGSAVPAGTASTTGTPKPTSATTKPATAAASGTPSASSGETPNTGSGELLLLVAVVIAVALVAVRRLRTAS